jgi:hypothetical protein
MIRPKPPSFRTYGRIKCQFDYEDPRPILGDLVKERRGAAPYDSVAVEAGVPALVILDLEEHFGAKAEEIGAVLAWLGKTATQVQLPTVIQERVYTMRKLPPGLKAELKNRMLNFVASGGIIPKFEDPEYGVSTGRAKKLFSKWMRNDKDFVTRFHQASALGTYHLAHEMLEIADNTLIDPQQKTHMIATRKWLAERVNPMVFGARQTVENNVNIGFAEAMEQLERRRKIAPPPQVIDVKPLEVNRRVEILDFEPPHGDDV